MNLDMYLTGEQFIWSWGGSNRRDIKEKLELAFEPSAIVFELAYWRKANAIHAWFVKHVQAGKDHCGTYPVTIEQLHALLNTVKMVKENHNLATSLCPTQSGFFFGDTGYGENYWADMDYTEKALGKVLIYPKLTQLEIEYHASW